MTISKRAEVDMVGYDVGNDIALRGNLQVRFALLTYEDDVLLNRQAHRVSLSPGLDIEAVMALVDVDLERKGFGVMPASDVDLVKSQAALIWTPEVVAAWTAHQKAEETEIVVQAAKMQAAARRKLEPWRFWTVVNKTFPEDGLRKAIEAAFARDTDKRARALAKLDHPPGGAFDRDDPLFEDADLMGALGVDAGLIDSLWEQAWRL